MSRRERPWTAGIPCWVDLTTSDPEGARAFYGALLGWDFEVGGPELGGYAQALADGVAAAGLGPAMVPGTPTAWTVHVATDDAEATARAAVDAGGSVVFGPMEIPALGVQVLLADPGGAVTGAWQSGPFIGAGIVNEPGALTWEDLRSADPDASRAFLSAVFGHVHDHFDGAPEGYSTFGLDDGLPLGGVGPLWEAPAPHWLVYFAVADADAAAATAAAHGARSVGAVHDTPFGRTATLTDPQGAVFAVIEDTGREQPDRS